MKLSVAVAGKEAPSSAFVVWRGFEESIIKAADLGYHGIELALKTADDINPNKLSSWLSKHNMEVSCISTGQVFATLGLYFTHPDASMRRKVIDLFSGLINLAGDFGQMVNVGRTRGFIGEGQSQEEAEQLFIDTSRQICDIASEHGVTIIIEPVNRYEINFVNNLDQGAELLVKVGRENLGLMPDVFHMNIEDAQIGASLSKHADLVKYIHFADSNRWAPGWGHLDFDDVFEGLRKGNFDGWASIEILPEPDPDSAARKAAETILPMIERYNMNR
ncbi:MAG: sugar phosphate isomerase/epimerase [Deltaproteobacteria bacterium]|nr:sugar phosphate isomerase/epimerase [Deltaproteobacteria bacterium]